MRRSLIALACVLACVAALPGRGPAAVSCGVEAEPAWIDFADSAVSFWRERFARPGVVLATGGTGIGTEARAAGAGVVHWDMYLRRKVGTPAAPADPAQIESRADVLYERAVAVTGCAQPLMALNELWGSWLPMPLTPSAAAYRENVLRFARRLAERGARPALLVSGRPFTEDGAEVWWREIGKVSDVVLEKYANANVIWKDGPIRGSRRLRESYRDSAVRLVAAGVPASRVGLMIGFQTGPGTGGREGLKPRSRWFDVAKWSAFAAGHVARELGLPHVWSWGWSQRDARSNDPDKTYAACVWLWARDPALCDAPGELRHELDADRTVGQHDLPAGVRCVYGEVELTASSLATLAKLTDDRELALTALVVRAVERERAAVTSADVLAVERRIVSTRFSRSAGAYRAALAELGAGLSVARAIIGDELRRQAIVSRLDPPRPSGADVARFRETFAAVLAREVLVSPAPSWLPEGEGIALASSAPESVFRARTRRWATVRTVEGSFRVRPLAEVTALGALEASLARSAIVRELRRERRADAYSAWTIRMQKRAAAGLSCARDRLPELAVVTLSSFAPFLALREAPSDAPAISGRGRGPG